MENLIYISVILPLKLDWEPCYSMEVPACQPGTRVRVRFAGKDYIGVVSAVGITPEIAPGKIFPIQEIESGLATITPAEISLWRKVADYYLCTTGEVYKAAYPALKTDQEMTAVRAEEREKEKARKLEEAFRQRVSRMEERLSAKEEKLATTTAPKAREALEKGIEKLRQELQQATEAYLKSHTPETETENLSEADAAVQSATQPTVHPGARLAVTVRPLEPLSASQEKAHEEILAAFDAGKPVLLQGVTGSGKTEIYMHLAEAALKAGRNVLYLVPEIAMSLQLEYRLKTFFGQRLLLFHSKESRLSREQTAIAVRQPVNGNYLLLGTRSALFLPHHDLGLIIIDEEHDNSYKQDSPVPKYNGRDTALMLSTLQTTPCKVLLGSATPSLESLYNCWSGKYRKVVLNEKYYKGTLPEIGIIDTLAERKKRGMVGNFSRKLIDRINETLARKEQVLILRARRSYAPVLQCQECGAIPKCPHCNVSLSWSKANGRMVCHYCGLSQPFDGKCPDCGGELKSLGAGTQRIEEEAMQLFPQARIARLDSDAAQNRNYEKRVIQDFAEGRIDILIGTQMIAKGFDFENLTLVVLLQADAILGLQDFRADEKAMQLMEQLRGRCGRREKKGRFIIQTSRSSHPVFTRLHGDEVIQDYEGLLAERKEFHFPPFTRLITIDLKDKNLKRMELMSRMLADELRKKGFDVTGPFAPPVDKISDWYLRGIRLNLPKNKELAASKKRLYQDIEEFTKERKYTGHIALDVDPV